MTTDEIKVLQKKIEVLTAAFDASFDGIHILDSDGRTVIINKACERIEGITRSDIGDKTIGQLVEEGFYSEPITLQVLEQNRPVTRVQRVKNGNKVLATGTPIYGDAGEITGVIVNSRDITELQQLKQELEEKKNLTRAYFDELNRIKAHRTILRDLVISSSKMERIVTTVLNVAKVDSNVLIEGESGTGKSLFSNLIHDNSSRSEGPFIKIDCGAVPETLFESELFGYEKGAFTGADQKGKIGLVQLAHRGTLFLDEIGEVPLSLQTKLLRFIQEKRFYKVGGKTPVSVDVRIIAATNRNLLEMVKEGRFREDLYYRINVVPIEMPALRDRREDIASLVLKHIERLNTEYGYHKRISGGALDMLLAYHWPGNIRELENVIERAMVMSGSDLLDVQDLPENLRTTACKTSFKKGAPLKNLLSDYEKMILETLIQEGHSPSEMAALLAIDVTNVRRKLHKYDISFK